MLAQISQVTRRPRGGVSLKPTQVNADALRIGRNAASEVLLPDVRVAVAEAVIQMRDGTLYLAQVGNHPIRVNGSAVASSPVKPGDEILIGPYRLEIVEPPPGVDAAVTVELVNPLGDDFARLQSVSKIGLDSTHLSKRRTAWALALGILVLFLALPIAAFVFNPQPDPRDPKPATRVIPAFFDDSWSVGEISNPHKNFRHECKACHEDAFTSVRDSACLTCHDKVQHHVDMAKFPTLVINNTPCGGCHQEHRGAHGVINRKQALCNDCHADLKGKAANAELRNATDFGTNHPEFRVSVVADAATKTLARVDLAGGPKPVDKPNLKFTHKGHLEPAAWPREMRKLVCADCHMPQPGGALMQPISFAQHCAECHDPTLKFDLNALDRAVPHGDAKLAQRAVQDFYARAALEGGYADLSAPEVVRRRPGAPLSEPERLEALAWARQRAATARDFVFDDFRGCGTCHEVDRSEPEYKIKPVLLLNRFLPKSVFNHQKHATVNCETCHDARPSIASSDVLIPAIDSCRSCHGGESASARVSSTCIACHDFHLPGKGPLRPFTKVGQTAAAKN